MPRATCARSSRKRRRSHRRRAIRAEPVARFAARRRQHVAVVPKKPQLWHATSGSLTYHDDEGHAHLRENVVVQSADQKMRGPVLDLYFTRSSRSTRTRRQPAATAAARIHRCAQQISRAVGTGGVTVEQGGRKATAERGEYTAATGKFVMSGGNPTLYDGSAGTTTGRQLTFFLADDTIIVDSENGSRTLTKHRVEKVKSIILTRDCVIPPRLRYAEAPGRRTEQVVSRPQGRR